MGTTFTTRYQIGDSVIVARYEETFRAVIDTVSFMQFKTNDGRLVTDLIYIGVDESGDRRTFSESECITK